VHHRLVAAAFAAGAILIDRQQVAVVVAADLDHRVDDLMQGQSLAIDLHHDRIHEERHVVVHQLDDGMRRLPAVFLRARVVDAQLRRAAGETAQEMPVRQGRAVEIGRRPLGDVVRRHLPEIAQREGLDQRRLGSRKPLAYRLQHGGDLIRLNLFGKARHTVSSCRRWPHARRGISRPAPRSPCPMRFLRVS
jgi:hypothetical protein